jgi:hypothetical protein
VDAVTHKRGMDRSRQHAYTPGVISRRSLVLIAPVISALAMSGAAGAHGADKEKIQLTTAGQAAARAALLTRADLGSTSGWTGGPKKPDLSSTPPCANFDPKQSDLTLNGAAEAVYKHAAGIQFRSNVQVLETAHMVALDWQRSVLAPQLLTCMRSGLAKSVGSRARVVSVERIAIPKLATYAAAFRAVIDLTAAHHIRVMVDVVLVGRGRTEVTLTTTAPFASVGTIGPAEIRLARLLAARIRL